MKGEDFENEDDEGLLGIVPRQVRGLALASQKPTSLAS